MLAHINTMFEAEQIGHFPLRTLAETHGHLLKKQEDKKHFEKCISINTLIYQSIYVFFFLASKI